MKDRTSMDCIASPGRRKSIPDVSCILSAFLGAFLIFQVQPIMGKYLLPWFGGVSSVWITSVLFFQCSLFLGYFYAYRSVRHLQPRGQAILYLAFLAVGIFFLPIIPSDSWKPLSATQPGMRILGLLAVTVGVPFVAVSATSPLLQSWHAREATGRSPYSLYAFSNLGSLLGLLTYPILVEPSLSIREQTNLWSWGYGLFLAICACVVWNVISRYPSSGKMLNAKARDEETFPSLNVRLPALWILLACAGTVMFLGVTNQLCLDVANIPFLWILPISLYLLSFILAFAGTKFYPRTFLLLLFPCAVWLVARLIPIVGLSIVQQVFLYGLALWVICWICHAEIHRLRPSGRHLPGFYLALSAGGVAGGTFVALIAPRLFTAYHELRVGLMLSVLGVLCSQIFAPPERGHRWRTHCAWLGGLLAAIALISSRGMEERLSTWSILEAKRNFYGVKRVVRADTDTPADRLILFNGNIAHGVQSLIPRLQDMPTAYFDQGSGIGHVMQSLQEARDLKVGVVGLGIGTLAAYMDAGDLLRFYEIDPQVVDMAEKHFTFLSSARSRGVHIEISQGDARLSLEREDPQGYDVLVLDAFTSDAVPVHLLTVEAFDIYARHLAEGGLVAINVSNQHLDLGSLVSRQADRLRKEAILMTSLGDPGRLAKPSEWVLISASSGLSSILGIQDGQPLSARNAPLWTDQYTSLIHVLR